MCESGIVGDKLIDPYVLPGHLNSQSSLQFLLGQITKLLENFPLAILQDIWYMLNGYPNQNSRLHIIIFRMEKGDTSGIAATVNPLQSLGLLFEASLTLSCIKTFYRM